MKQMSTLFQICVYLTVSLLIITLSINFVNGLGIFVVAAPPGYAPGDTTNETFTRLTNITSTTGETGGISFLWEILFAGLAGGLVVGVLTRSMSLVGVWIFISTFWISYYNMIFGLNLNNYIMPEFLLIGTVAVGFIFVGAVSGMLSGSG